MARYIDADLLIKNIASIEDLRTLSTKTIGEAIDKTPTADVVEVKHAKWEINSDGYYPYCCNCKTEPKNGLMSKYCPECGAVMDGTPKERGGEK